jgi:hypothetical protein
MKNWMFDYRADPDETKPLSPEQMTSKVKQSRAKLEAVIRKYEHPGFECAR